VTCNLCSHMSGHDSGSRMNNDGGGHGGVVVYLRGSAAHSWHWAPGIGHNGRGYRWRSVRREGSEVCEVRGASGPRTLLSDWSLGKAE
jgi:hypothetical protein